MLTPATPNSRTISTLKVHSRLKAFCLSVLYILLCPAVQLIEHRGTQYCIENGLGWVFTAMYARKRLMPTFLKERQYRNNKVSIEYPARLVINGKTVIGEFPDWHTVLYQDRYQLLATLSDPPTYVQTHSGQYHSPAGAVAVPAPPPPLRSGLQSPPSPRQERQVYITLISHRVDRDSTRVLL